ncbi:hypothetical protein N657DRAFT_624523 [Parathielavia appendiculata]|uniref:Uncharacterized protein n=1 Tax=Parathielavia appendiculata TaxID=2587402 RepID=A0AAN6TVD0_9PEZI|nr:hypothetical protein N657DRAFT_624523 [Parathielavia appendiculata]
MAVMTVLSLIVTLFLTSVFANTEKTIFLGPEPIPLTVVHSTLSDLRLETLTPANGTLRTKINAQFPRTEHSKGTTTWLVLDKLTPNQRYEVRVCWPATQPTELSLSTFPLSAVRDDAELMASLHAYSASRHHSYPNETTHFSIQGNSSERGEQASILLLHILAAADYFTTDTSLMRDVPPVDVDIILDPFLMNVLPRSIAGTACYIVAVAVVTFHLARRMSLWFQELITCGRGSSSKRSVKKRQ